MRAALGSKPDKAWHLPRIVMNPLGVEAVCWLCCAIWISNRYQGKRVYMGWEVQHARNVLDAVIVGVDPQPNSTQPQCMCGKQDIFCCCRAVQDVAVWSFFKLIVTANQYGQGCQVQASGGRMEGGYLFHEVPIIDDHEMPWLGIGCRRSLHGGLNKLIHQVFRDRIGFIVADTTPGQYCVHQFHH